jgi:hypothetical protein
LAGQNLDESLRLVERALAATGHRSDFLDTKAVIHVMRGELDAALVAANGAARMRPQDPYMLWQAERIARLIAQEGT